MRIHVIACQVFSRHLYAAAAACDNIIELTLLPQGLHDTPDLLRKMVEEAIRKVEERYDQGLSKHLPDAIALGYGLCSNGVAGITAGRVPLVIPRTDDCIGIFLGSQGRYLDLFGRYPGIYWLNGGWIESAFIPTREQLAARQQEYVELYGEDNAAYLLEEDHRWMGKYRYLGFISSELDQGEAYKKLAQQTALLHGWKFLHVEGNDRLLRQLLSGTWKEEEFLVCPPGCQIEPSFDRTKIRAQNSEEE